MTIKNHLNARPGSPAERGVVLIWVLIVLLLVAGIILSGTQEQEALDRATRFGSADPAHARAVATAGLVDAFAWFRRQQVQPVTSFAPSRDISATPSVNETDNASVGLVREYEVAPSLWGRYEVRLAVAAEPFTDEDDDGLYDQGEPYSDNNANGRWDAAREVQDVSVERGVSGNGVVWMLQSHGYLYARPRSDLPLDTAPNSRIAYASVATEIRRLSIAPPTAAAICADRADAVTIGNRGRILGASGAGVSFAESTGAPVFQSGSEVSGSPASTSVPNYDASLEKVFGVGVAELRSMADTSTNDASTVPSPLGDYSLTVMDGDITFDAARPLRGTGVVVVLGDCTIASGSNSFFSGLLWVQGDLSVEAPAYLRGVFIARGDVQVQGLGGDYAEINYDNAILTELLFLMGQYRHTKAVFEADGDPKSLAVLGGS